MRDQPKFEPYEATSLFPDGTSARPLVEHTVARGLPLTDTLLYAGSENGTPAQSLPFAVTAELLARGQERYGIFCTPCHGLDGYGQGMIVRRGFSPPPSLHEERLHQLPDGYLFQIISEGRGVMYGYGDRVPPADRWAIVAYIRALQLSQSASVDDVPAEARPQLEAIGP
jgi:mono/diheme cytochrome c family protein